MSDLTEFLLARIAEDEARALAECEAKRRIVEYATGQHTGTIEGLDILAILALPYTDHPDYRQEWNGASG